MSYETPEPALADAYRATTRAVRREQARAAYIEQRFPALRRLCDPRSLPLVRVAPGPWAPAGMREITLAADLAYWIAERRELTSALVLLLLGDRDSIVKHYASDRSAAEADALDDDIVDHVER